MKNENSSGHSCLITLSRNEFGEKLLSCGISDQFALEWQFALQSGSVITASFVVSLYFQFALA